MILNILFYFTLFFISAFFLSSRWFGLLFLGHEPSAQRRLALPHIREESSDVKVMFRR